MAFPQGIDFRATSGYVTDPTNCDYEISTGGNYPRTSAQGNTIGWESTGLTTRNRNAGNPANLAGVHISPAGTVKTYRVDLPATGSYNVRLAAGDASYANPVKVELFDDTTSLGVLASTAPTAANKFRDATNAEHTAANWEANNTAFNATFASTILRIKNGSASSCVIAHFWVESAGGATTHVTSGTLTGAASTIVGTSAHIAKHISTGTLSGQSGTVVGSAARKRVMTSSGALLGTGAAIVGAAARSASGVHTTTGALVGATSVIVGSATRKVVHTTTAVLTGVASVIVGVAKIQKIHSSTGVLTSVASIIVGAASKALVLSSTPARHTAHVEPLNNTIDVPILYNSFDVEP